MYAIACTVLVGIYGILADAGEKLNIDEALESVETVLRFHKHDPSSDLAVINKVQKVLDRIKSASKYTEDMFSPNQYRANLPKTEMRPMAIRWEDGLFSYEILRNKKKRKKDVNENRLRAEQNVEQITDDTEDSGPVNLRSESNNYTSLTNIENVDEETDTFSHNDTINTTQYNHSSKISKERLDKNMTPTEKNNKQNFKDNYKSASKESLPELKYALEESELTASTSTESDNISGPGDPTVASSDQIVQDVHYRSNLLTEMPEEIMPENYVKNVKIKVGVMHKNSKNKEVQVEDNKKKVMAKQIQTFKYTRAAFSHTFKSEDSHTNVTTASISKPVYRAGTTKRNKFENTKTNKKTNITNNAKFSFSYFTNQKSGDKIEKSSNRIIESSSIIGVELPRKITKEENNFNNLFLSKEADEIFTNPKQSDHYSLNQDNIPETIHFKSRSEKGGEDFIVSTNMNDDNPKLDKDNTLTEVTKLTVPYLNDVTNELAKEEELEETVVEKTKNNRDFNKTDFNYFYITKKRGFGNVNKPKSEILGYSTVGDKLNFLPQTRTKLEKLNNAHKNKNITKFDIAGDWDFKYKYLSQEISDEKTKHLKGSIFSRSRIFDIDEMTEASELNSIKKQDFVNMNLTQNANDNFDKSTSIVWRSENKDTITNTETNENITNDKLSNKEIDLLDFTLSPKYVETTNSANREKRTPKYINITLDTGASKSMSPKASLRRGDAKKELGNREANKTKEVHRFNVANEWDFAYDDFINERRKPMTSN